MLGINPTKSAKKTKEYYPQDDYYGKKGSVVGKWMGKTATMLGLPANVNQSDFGDLCDNLHPIQKKQITQKTRADRRTGYDFTFSLWKSASVLFTLYHDQRILEVFNAAVLSTMLAIEPFVEARVRVGGADYNRITGNLVAAPFLHRLTRPEDGLPDPHVHTHVVALNMTWDEIERKWKAGQFGRIKGMGHFFEEMFDARLAEGLRGLGYQVERRGKTADYEISGVSSAVVNKFSTRTKKINKKAKELGITDPRQKALLAKITRKAKIDDLDQEELMACWKQRLSAEEDRHLQAVVRNAIELGPVAPAQHPTAHEMLDYAVGHLFERCSVVEEHRLLAAAMEYGAGAVTVEELQAALNASDVIREKQDGEVWLTTEAVLREEAECVSFARETRGTLAPIRHVTEAPDPALSPEQWNAFRHVLESQDRVTAISGSPGSGKTTIMTPIINSIRREGLEVLTFAPSAEASRKVLRDEGFSNADTLTRFLLDTKLQEQARGQVVWIDEAGLIGAADMHRLFLLSQEKNFRLVLSGDIGQHGPVARGDALRLLIDHAGLKPAEVKTVRRQKVQAYLEAVQAINDQDLQAGYAMLDQAGFIREIEDGTDRLGALADAYVRALGKKEDCLVISPTHAEGSRVTDAIREKLRAAHRLAGQETEILQLEDLKWSEEERRNPAKYQEGLVVQFHQNGGGKILRGDRFTVTSVDREEIEMRGQNGKTTILPLKSAKCFNVYEVKSLPVSQGELLRVTANGKSKNGRRLENGTALRIKEISQDGDVICTNGVVLDSHHGHLSHGYCSTSHGSQGKTVDHVFLAQSDESLGRVASKQQFLVSVSRGRKSAQIFTDNKEHLLWAVSKSAARKSAHDLLNEKRRQQALRRAQVRAVHGRNQTIQNFPRENPAPVAELLPVLAVSEQAENHEQDAPILFQKISAPVPETPADLPDLNEQTDNHEPEIAL